MAAFVNEAVRQLKYLQRVVAFVDILGFGALVKRADGDPTLRERIFGVLQNVHAFAAPTESNTDFKAQNFSDSLIISATNTADGLWHVLFSLSDLAINLLEIGVVVRGGVTVGGIHHDGDVVFGLGVNEAYRLESTIAAVPRIVLGATALSAANQYATQHEIWGTYRSSRLLRDRDGVWFLNIFCELGIFSRQGGMLEEHPLYQRGTVIREAIQAQIDSTIDQPDVYEKLRWLASYWNREVGQGMAKFIQPMLPGVTLAGDELRQRPLPFSANFPPKMDGADE
ncbi:hypothetical protein [Ferrovibrio sp.]|uniref:hypothetical protein n=1 Tax=Ferrovibrio sp. TaxID=1917215 RepID=UPI003518131E